MKIGIVNDMPLAIEVLRRLLASKPEYRVIWTARNGAEAVDFCAQETPDLVLMDLMMPAMDGVEATRQIMAANPCAILVVTVSVNTNAQQVFEAMGHGALNAVDTPVLRRVGAPNEGAAPLLAKIETISKLIGDKSVTRNTSKQRINAMSLSRSNLLVAIGASAGGPAAVARILEGLPKNFPAAIVIVQHVDERFAVSMAEWLGQHSVLPVRVVKENDRAMPGEVLLAGTNDHLVLNAPDRFGYQAEPRDYVYRPSVDVFFQSIVQHWHGEVIGILLTGMGRDGAHGLKGLRSKGHHTIAQDQATSAVYGMPKAAAALEAATEILPLECIAPRLTEMVSLRKPLNKR